MIKYGIGEEENATEGNKKRSEMEGNNITKQVRKLKERKRG